MLKHRISRGEEFEKENFSMKKMIFINQDVGYLMIDIVNKFVDEGYDCVLITGRVIERKNPLNKKVKIDNIIEYNRNTIAHRIISWVVGFFQIWFKILFKYRKEELFIVSNPPIAPLLPLVSSNDYYQLVFDLDFVWALDVGIIKNVKLFTRLWKLIIKKSYRRAKGVFTLTKGMGEILEKFTEGKKVHVMPLWTDNSEFKVVNKRDNPFVIEHNFQDKFVVMYSGNIGVTSGVEPLIEVAKLTRNKNILFLIVGQGLRKEALMLKAEEYKLANCIFMPWQQPSVLPFSLAAADLAVVSLGGKDSKLSIPSKLFNNMSVGNPILGITMKDSDLAHTIESLDVGRVFESNEIQEITDFIDTLSLDKEMQETFQFNSREASGKFTPENINIILDVVQKA